MEGMERTGSHLVAARVVQAMQARGLSADGRELYLELVEHAERLVELGVYLWHMGAESVFVGAAIVALKVLSRSFIAHRENDSEDGWHHTP
jgi:hypothetical protein